MAEDDLAERLENPSINCKTRMSESEDATKRSERNFINQEEESVSELVSRKGKLWVGLGFGKLT